MRHNDKKVMGTLYVVSAPSGTGKTTLVQALTDSMQKITVSVSHTTRPKRPLEVNKINYYFIDKTNFEQRIAEGDFLEHAIIFNHYYGTSKKWVIETLASGIDVILEIDWQGHQQIKKVLPSTIGIFILPPSLADLRKRLVTRNQDRADVIQTRLKDAKETVSHIHEFDYVVINDDFERALADLKTIVKSGRLKIDQQCQRYEKLIADFKQLNIESDIPPI